MKLEPIVIDGKKLFRLATKGNECIPLSLPKCFWDKAGNCQMPSKLGMMSAPTSPCHHAIFLDDAGRLDLITRRLTR